jgi:hypothetical protein
MIYRSFQQSRNRAAEYLYNLVFTNSHGFHQAALDISIECLAGRPVFEQHNPAAFQKRKKEANHEDH